MREWRSLARCLLEICAGERFVIVVANYRLSPGVTHSAHVQGAAAELAWVKKNVAAHNSGREASEIHYHPLPSG